MNVGKPASLLEMENSLFSKLDLHSVVFLTALLNSYKMRDGNHGKFADVFFQNERKQGQ